MRANLKIIVMAYLFIFALSFAYASDNKEKAQMYYRKGALYYEKGKYKNANEQFQKALDLLCEKEDHVTDEGSEKEVEKKPVVNRLLGISTFSSQERQIIKSYEDSAAARSLGGTRGYPEYVVGDGDVLGVFVWQNPDLTQEAIVRPDGRISFPLVGDIMAYGKTISQIDTEITERLKEYIKYPDVSVSIKKLGGGKVIVLGQVKMPGVYYVTGRKTLLEAVALAQGFTDDTLASTTIVIKGIFSGRPKVIRVSANKALKGSMFNNIMLESEDVVFVPKKPIKDLQYLLDTILDPLSKGAFTSKSLLAF